MQRNAAVLAGVSMVPILGLQFGAFGSLLTYAIVAGYAAYLALRLNGAHFTAMGVACIVLIIAHVCRFIWGEAVYQIVLLIGYVFIANAAVRILLKTSKRAELASTLEIGAIASALAVLVLYNGVLAVPTTKTAVVILSTVAMLFGIMSDLGKAVNMMLKLFVLAMFIATWMESLDHNFTESSFSAIWSLPYYPIIAGLLLPEQHQQLRPSQTSARRTFGLPQLVLFGATLVAPIITILIAAVMPIGWSLLSLLIQGLLLWRFRLLIRLRDWSYNQEQLLRLYGEHLLTLTDEAEIDSVTVDTLFTLVGSRGKVAILDSADDIGFEQVRSEGNVIPRPRTRSRTVRYGEADSPVDAWFVHDRRGGSQLAVKVPTVDSSSPPRYFVHEATEALNADVEEHFRSAAAQYSLAIRSQRLARQVQDERANNRFNTLSQDINDIVFLVDPTGYNVEFVGPTVQRLLGYSAGAYIGRSVLTHVLDDDRAKAQSLLSNADDTSIRNVKDIRLELADGSIRWFELSVRVLGPGDDGDLRGLLASFSDIHDRKMAGLNLKNSEAQFRTLVQNSSDVSMLVDTSMTVSYVSPNVNRVLDFDPQDLVGTSLLGLFEDQSHETVTELVRNCRGTDAPLLGEVLIRTRKGSHDRVAEISVARSELNEQENFVVIVRDISVRRQLEDSLRTKALYDELTGLLNRAAFIHQVQSKLQALEDDQHLAIVTLDLRGFQEINDSSGFKTGDRILATVASRLRATLRRDDILARLSADEFTICTEVASEERAVKLATRMIGVVQQMLTIDDATFHLGTSVGVRVTDDRGANPSALLHQSIIATHRSKTTSPDDVVVFTESMQEEAAEKMELAADLRGAVRDNEFHLVFQPLVHLSDNSVYGFEALLRWEHPTRGYVSPGVFIPLAESNGTIVEIGRWVLRDACRKLVRWKQDDGKFASTMISVNVSARQLDSDAVEVRRLAEIISQSGIKASDLTIELTESTMIRDTTSINDQLSYLRSIGCKIAIDDFGTGVSGLARLRELPVDIVKIDKSYIDKLGVSEEGTRLVRQIIELARGIGAVSVAEGIETPQQAELLAEMNCDVGQGFYLARPMSEPQLMEWFEARMNGRLVSR